jgi:hypothetical protein
MATSEDYGKYFCALGSRSVRRVAAKVYAASELDAEVRIAMLKELTQAVQWQRMATVADPQDRRPATVPGTGHVYGRRQRLFRPVHRGHAGKGLRRRPCGHNSRQCTFGAVPAAAILAEASPRCHHPANSTRPRPTGAGMVHRERRRS